MFRYLLPEKCLLSHEILKIVVLFTLFFHMTALNETNHRYFEMPTKFYCYGEIR